MRVLIDRKGLQASWHLEDNLRLCVFLTELLRASYAIAFSPEQTFTAEELNEYDVLIITTRPRTKDYTEAEIESILAFVGKGGGLLLMANHADLPNGKRKDLRKCDAKLASRFGATLERTFFENSRQGKLTRISGSDLNDKHPIIAGMPGKELVELVVTNTCCSIASGKGARLISLPEEMTNRRDHRPPKEQWFACALDGGCGLDPESNGRVVVIADSGFIGTDCTTRPGRGLIGHGDNQLFISNVIRWLGGEL